MPSPDIISEHIRNLEPFFWGWSELPKPINQDKYVWESQEYGVRFKLVKMGGQIPEAEATIPEVLLLLVNGNWRGRERLLQDFLVPLEEPTLKTSKRGSSFVVWETKSRIT